jgi:hypothetical protein
MKRTRGINPRVALINGALQESRSICNRFRYRSYTLLFRLQLGREHDIV